MERHPGSQKPLAQAVGLALVGLASAVHGQGAPASATAASAPANVAPAQTLETVTITAQGRAQALQDVPISVKSFSAKEIEKSGITSTQSPRSSRTCTSHRTARSPRSRSSS